MSCEVAALPIQAHAKFGTWSIDFKKEHLNKLVLIYINLCNFKGGNDRVYFQSNVYLDFFPLVILKCKIILQIKS